MGQPRARRRRWPIVLAGAAAVGVLGVGAAAYLWPGTTPVISVASCTATAGSAEVVLGTAETANAATIAAVGKRAGLPDHAVTVALAAALQESKLRNLDYGDLDSVGLFQQRPSQGWGTPEQLRDPSYAAAAFYNRLAEVPGWETMSVTDAAQAVQHSAGPTAYARWEPRARTLSTVLTGQVPAGLRCRYDLPPGGATPGTVTSGLTREAGSAGVGTTVPSARGWLVASWLVAHGEAQGVASVSFDGMTWTPGSGRWRQQPPKRSEVAFQMAPSRPS